MFDHMRGQNHVECSFRYQRQVVPIEVEFKSGDGKPSGRILLGSKTPTGGNLYAKRNDEKRVFLVADFQDSSLNKSTFNLRDKTLIKIARDKVDGVEVDVSGKPIQFAKDGSDWKITKPIAARADFSSVEGLVGRVETAQMKSIVTDQASPDDLKKYGLDKPDVTVTIHQGSARAVVEIGGKVEGLHPRCACGEIMEKKYTSPVSAYLDFLRVEEPAGVRTALREIDHA